VTTPHLLIVGAGSVGKRHARNFRQLGCHISLMDPRQDRLDEALSEGPALGTHRDLTHALEQAPMPSGIVICSPPKYHVEAAEAAFARGLPVFLEKPVSPGLAEAEELRASQRRSRVPLLLGYTYRWWPALGQLRNRLTAGEIGDVLHVNCVMSAHLEDWHPWERYQDFFMASRDLGGGALLDESHFLDLVLWFFGTPEEVSGRVEHISALQIDSDDNVDALLVYKRGLRASVHLDLYGRPHEKYMTFTGTHGTLQWSFDPNRIRLARTAGQEWTDTSFSGDRNDMFLAAAAEFLQVLAGREPSCTLDDGCRVLEVIEALRQSSDTGRSIRLAQ
jgi:predicted dehydrogenase